MKLSLFLLFCLFSYNNFCMTEKQFLINFLKPHITQYGLTYVFEYYPKEIIQLLKIINREKLLQQEQFIQQDPFIHSNLSIDYPPLSDTEINTIVTTPRPPQRSLTPQPRISYESSRTNHVNLNTQEIAPLFDTRQSIFTRLQFSDL